MKLTQKKIMEYALYQYMCDIKKAKKRFYKSAGAK